MSSEPVAIESPDYKVADIALADWGRKEIQIAGGAYGTNREECAVPMC